MPNPTPLNALLVAILNGRYDEKLDLVNKKVFRAIQNRRLALSTEVSEGLVIGDKVKLKKGNYKPRYFQGLTGTITSIADAVVWVKLDKPIIRKTKTIGSVGVQAIYVELAE